MTVSYSAVGTWFQRYQGLISAGGEVLDLACGAGRHARFFADLGHPVTAVDRDLAAVSDLADDPRFELIEADLEACAWPLGQRVFAAVVVSNYLWRPLAAQIVTAVAPAGVLLYQTFGVGNEQFGRPKNPDFLLAPGELLTWLDPGFCVVGYEHGVEDEVRVVQRLCAVRGSGPVALGAVPTGS